MKVKTTMTVAGGLLAAVAGVAAYGGFTQSDEPSETPTPTPTTVTSSTTTTSKTSTISSATTSSTTVTSSSSAAPTTTSMEPTPTEELPPPEPTSPDTQPAQLFGTAPQSNVSYGSCREVWNKVGGPISQGEPGYSSKLDRDGDGVACESRPK
ncbi:excalibur calcium-binding domain-containing protein [Corynebacterium glucuronolyticum]|uniref:excalibur calcium-binding domain-containing protein n=1 Tax=Corynebacterium glucuronolyticum TaxID=39791 RepID=UPI003F6DB1BB